MGCMTQLLGVRRDETSREVEAMIGEAWQGRDLQVRARIVAQLGTPRGFRNPMGMTWSLARSAIHRAIVAATARDLALVLQLCFVNSHGALLAQCYRRVGIGTPADSEKDVLAHTSPPPTREQYESGWATLDEAERPRFALFVAALADVGIEKWRAAAADAFVSTILPALAPAPAAVSEPAEVPAPEAAAAETDDVLWEQHEEDLAESAGADADASDEAIAEDAEDADAASVRAAHAPRTPVRLTVLDRAIIDLVVQSVAGQHGSLPPEAVGLITEELITLNSKRVQSRFHVGYLAALSGKPLPSRRPDDNDQRRAWLVAGWMMGHHRRDPYTSVNRFAELPAQDKEAFLGARDASEGTANEIVAHLTRHDDRSAQLLEWIGRAGPEGIAHAVSCVERLHRQDRGSEALAICEQVLDASRHYVHVSALGPMLQQALVLLAKSHRMVGQFREAEQLLEAIDGQHDGASGHEAAHDGGGRAAAVQSDTLRYMIGLERLLCALHAGHSWDVWIPPERSDRTALDRLNGCADLVKRCLKEAEGAPLPGVAYLYGLWCILKGSESPSDGWPDPRAVITGSLGAHMVTTDVDTVNPLRARLKVLEALLSVGDGGARTANAIESIVEYESAHGVLPFHSVKGAIEVALVEGAEAAWKLVLPRLGSDFTQFSNEGMLTLCLQNGRLVQELVTSREELGKRLDGRQRVLMMGELFKAAADQNLPREVLSDLADELIMRVSEFTDAAAEALDALDKADRWSKVWNEEEFIAVRAGLAGWCPEHVRVPIRAQILQRAHALARQDPDMALELLDYCEVLGEPHDSTLVTRQLVKRLEHQQAQAAQTAHGGEFRRVRVLFVGGDERQQNQQAAIRSRVIAERPNTEVTFMHPGWSANWGHALDRAAVAVDGADIVVMLRFIRTRFGEGLRRAINDRGKQWRPVYGHAAPSIARAIVQAANDVVVQG